MGVIFENRPQEERWVRFDYYARKGLAVGEIAALTGLARGTIGQKLGDYDGVFPSEARVGSVFDVLLRLAASPGGAPRGRELRSLCDGLDCLLCGVGSDWVLDKTKTFDRSRYRAALVAVAYGYCGVSLNSMALRWGFHHTSLMALVQKFAEARGWQADEAGFRLAVRHHAQALRPNRHGAGVVV